MDVDLENIFHTFKNLANNRLIVYHKNWLKNEITGEDIIAIDQDEDADKFRFIHCDETTLNGINE